MAINMAKYTAVIICIALLAVSSWSVNGAFLAPYRIPTTGKPHISTTQVRHVLSLRSRRYLPFSLPESRRISITKLAAGETDDDIDRKFVDDDDSESGRSIPSQPSKEDIVKAVGEKMRSQKSRSKDAEDSSNLFNRFNPFKAGQNLRKSLDTAFDSISPDRKALYYLDDRLNEGISAFERNPALERLEQDDFVPEVLVVGATGEVGRLVVRRLLLDGRFRVRVLVRNLYTKTLNLLGTGVTYCQGDLGNPDSLEYALTDVDKIIFCASAPRPDEDQFQQKFKDFLKETLESNDAEIQSKKLVSNDKLQTTIDDNSEWEQLESVLEVRARLAEQIDCIGMQNLVRAYQDVRVADYGTSQAAKRSLFKFQDRPEDFNLFAIDDDDEDEGTKTLQPVLSNKGASSKGSDYNYFDGYNEEDEYAEYDEEYGADFENRRDESVKTQVQWIRNQFEHGVFVGKVPKQKSSGVGGEAAVVSSRLRSRDDPDNGIDLSASFAGFIARVCADGGTYEAFVRTGAYYDEGIEHVCEFSTATKITGKNKSPNKFITVRLPFESFKPVKRKGSTTKNKSFDDSVRTFRGQDVRHIGFRYRASSPANAFKAKLEAGDWSSFYLALCYIKLYRSQPEPEFVYVSDARIPPAVRSNMVRHDVRMLVAASTSSRNENELQLFDESTLKTVVAKDKMARSAEETYYKYRGEEILKNSGLSYSIVRVPGYNEMPSGEASTIDLRSEAGELDAMSRDEVAQVIVSALLDPNALNKSFYVGKKKGKSQSVDEDISSRFAELPTDAII